MSDEEIWLLFMHAAISADQPMTVRSTEGLGPTYRTSADVDRAATTADKALEEYKKRWGDEQAD